MKQFILQLLIITAYCFTCNLCHAQFPSIPGVTDAKGVDFVKNNPLIVVTETPNQKVLDKLSKKNNDEQIHNYQNAIDNYNRLMRKAVTKFWAYSSNITYKTSDEVDSMIKAKNKNFAVLSSITFSQGYPVQHDLEWGAFDFKNIKKHNRGFSWSTTVMEIKEIEDYNDKKAIPVCQVGLQDIIPVESDLIFGVRFLQWFLSNGKVYIKTMKKNGNLLTQKTLLIRKDYIDSSLSTDKIKSLYPFNFLIADSTTFEKFVDSSDNDFAYVSMTPWVANISGANANQSNSPGGAAQTQYDVTNQVFNNTAKANDQATGSSNVMHYYFIIDAQTGDVLGEVIPHMGALMLSGFGSHGDLGSSSVNDRILKEIAKEAIGKGAL